MFSLLPRPRPTPFSFAPVLVDVGEDQERVLLERVVHAVAVVNIDVHVGDLLQAVPPAQHLGDHAAVVEDAESGRMAARGMVQPRDRHEGPPGVAAHQGLGRLQRRADHAAGRLEDPLPRRGVPGIEVARAGRGTLAHEADEGCGMEPVQLFHRRLPRRHRFH